MFGNGGVESIGEYAFAGCTALQSFQLGDSLKNIDGYAFYGCTSVTSTTFIGGLPASLERIGVYAFTARACGTEQAAWCMWATGLWASTARRCT